jgi:GcrA cell cycle regulator
MAAVWPEERVKRLRELRALGWSGSQIAARLGCSRNAVIGKLARLDGKEYQRSPRERPLRSRYRVVNVRPPKPPKLPPPKPVRRPDPFRFEHTPDELKRPGIIPHEPPTPIGMPAARATGTAAAVLAVKRVDCRWPIGDPREAGFRFCGATREGSGMYCAHHKQAAIGRRHDTDERSDSDGSDGTEEMCEGHRGVSR